MKKPVQRPGYKHAPKPVLPDAVWLTANQVMARYGGRSQMWLHRKLNDPDFPKARYDGRLRLFSRAALDDYDRKILAKHTTAQMRNAPPRNEALRKRDAEATS